MDLGSFIRYNPDNLQKLERYVELQAQENMYDLEANLSVLRLYQFGPNFYRSNIVNLILLKAMTNLPHTDFLLCKCLLTQDRVFNGFLLTNLPIIRIFSSELEEPQVSRVMVLADLLETCKFKQFWEELAKCGDLIITVQGPIPLYSARALSVQSKWDFWRAAWATRAPYLGLHDWLAISRPILKL